MSRTWQRPGRRSCFHVVLWTGVLAMWSPGAGVQVMAKKNIILPAPEACCWRGITGGCVLTTQANCSGPCDTWSGSGTTCPTSCPAQDPVACFFPGSSCVDTPECNCTAIGGVPQFPGPACVDLKNILVIVADDLGVDMLKVYGEGFEKACDVNGNECTTDDDCDDAGEVCQENLPPTPNIDALRANGILFRNAWANPTCSPMRATVQTGRYGLRTTVGFAGNPLPLEEIIIPEVLTQQPGVIPRYAHAAIGKWHLGGGPNDHGYSHFAGTQQNIGDYFEWQRIVNGVADDLMEMEYATTVNVDDALGWIGQQTKPWFMWLAFNAPHTPIQAPPGGLHSYHGMIRPALPVPDEEGTHPICEDPYRRLCYEAMIEALDTEVGRLLGSLLEEGVLNNTLIIFVGDNGTWGEVTVPPFDPTHAKFKLYEGGINVPLIISGAGVTNPGRESSALVNTTDLFATILETAGIDVANALPEGLLLDSVSLVPIINDPPSDSLRAFVFSDQFRQRGSNINDGVTIRNQDGFKLIRFTNPPTTNTVEFYDLLDDPFEKKDLYDDDAPDLDPWQQFNYDELLELLEQVEQPDPIGLPLGELPD